LLLVCIKSLAKVVRLTVTSVSKIRDRSETLFSFLFLFWLVSLETLVCSWTNLANLENTQLTHIQGLHILFPLFWQDTKSANYGNLPPPLHLP